jgi:surface protein
LKCVKCELGYELKDNICIKSKCDSGENDKCLSCQTNINKEKNCLECNEGYYLPQNQINKDKCIKCPIDGCKKCDNNICYECKDFYDPIYNNNYPSMISSCKLRCEIGTKEKCVTCNMEHGTESECSSCNEGYRLMKNGKCKKIENSFIAIYKVKYSYKYIKLMYLYKNGIKITDFSMFANGTKIVPIIGNKNNNIGYVFPKIGDVEIKVIFNKTLTSMKNLFAECYDLISIEFNETFDTSHVLDMQYMFQSCDNMKYANVSSFNTSIVGDMMEMFCNCDELTSLDLSNFNTRNVDYMQSMFSHSEKLSYLDISSFETTYVEGYSYMFNEIAENGTIIIGKKFTISNIPKNWKVIEK